MSHNCCGSKSQILPVCLCGFKAQHTQVEDAQLEVFTKQKEPRVYGGPISNRNVASILVDRPRFFPRFRIGEVSLFFLQFWCPSTPPTPAN